MAEPIPIPLRLAGTLLRWLPGISISRMTRAQVIAAQDAPPAHGFTARMMAAGLGSVGTSVTTADRTIPGPGGPLAIRVYTPATPALGPRPLVVYLHGGGWTLGTIDQGDWMCGSTARDAGAVVVSVAYRLAPRHPFPAAVDDAMAALAWCRAEAAALGADPDRMGVMGDSAGGNLAAVVALADRDAGGPRLRHQALLYPVTDGAMTSASYRANAEAPILTAADMAAFYGHYLAPGTDPLGPGVSPLRASSHAGLPQAIVVTAGHDPLHDEGVAYAEALRAAGVAVELADYPAMVHGFLSIPRGARDAAQAMARVTASQRQALT